MVNYQKILYHSTVGYLTIASDDHYIKKISFGKGTLPSDTQWNEAHGLLLKAEKQLMEYFCGQRKVFSLPLATCGTPFQQAVWNVLQQIPYGETITYGQLAQMIDKPNAARAVGGGCNKNPIAIVIPCHRVIGAGGKLTGFAGGLTVKERLLALEAEYNFNCCTYIK